MSQMSSHDKMQVVFWQYMEALVCNNIQAVAIDVQLEHTSGRGWHDDIGP